AARSLVTSGSSSSAGNGDKWSSSSTRSTPLRAAAATASTPAVTLASKGFKKVAALLVKASRRARNSASGTAPCALKATSSPSSVLYIAAQLTVAGTSAAA